MQNIIKSLIEKQIINAAHDCSDGGLYITLTEMAMAANLGYDIITSSEIREDAFLFGESQGRVIITITREMEDNFVDFKALTKEIKIVSLEELLNIFPNMLDGKTYGRTIVDLNK